MHTIEVDDDVFAHIEAHASGFSATPNSVLRRLLGVDEGAVRPGRQGRPDHTGQGGPGRFGAGGPNGWGPSGSRRIGGGGPSGPPQPRQKQRKADLSALVAAGILKEGQKLFLRDFKGRAVREVVAEVRNGQVWFNGQNWAMSNLAKSELKKNRGYRTNSYRGPKHWYIEDGRDISDLWDEYLATVPAESFPDGAASAPED